MHLDALAAQQPVAVRAILRGCAEPPTAIGAPGGLAAGLVVVADSLSIHNHSSSSTSSKTNLAAFPSIG